MPQERTHFGTTRQARAFRWLSRADITHESLAAYLDDCTGQHVDRSLVSMWANGKRPVDAEAWLLALEHAGDKAHLVLDALAQEHGCIVVVAPKPVAGAAPTSSRRALLMSALAGEVSRLTAEATDPASHGGAEITADERTVIANVERDLARLLATPATRPITSESGR